MKRSIALVFVLFAVLSSCEEACSSSSSNVADCATNLQSVKPYDHYVLAMQWGPTMCHQGCPRDARKKMNELREFSLHGLWPSLGNTRGPTSCRRDSFQENDISDEVHAGMEKAWFSFMKKSDAEFWKHEWEKHGTCAHDLPGMTGFVNEDQYFGTVLKLRERYNLLEALTAEGITPSDDKPYYGSDIDDAIYKHYGHRVNLMGSSRGGKYSLLQVYMCLDLNFDVIDCQQTRHDHQFDYREVYVPEFD